MFAVSILTIIAILFGAFATFPFIMGFFGRNKFDVAGKTVLITGASQGMGKSVAQQLAAKGANIIIVARDVAKLEAALAEIKASASNVTRQRFHYISTDLTSPEGNNKVVDEAIAWNNGRAPDVVWCIAGSSYPQFWVETPVEKLRSQMDVNFWAAAYLAHATLRSWLSPTSPNKGTERHLIFTGSTTAFYTVVGFATYSPAKAALRNLSDALKSEVQLYGEDVNIHTVFPSAISSPGFDNENKSKPDICLTLEEMDPVQTPDEVAAKAIKGLENGEYLVTTTFLGQAMRAQMWSGVSKNNWLWDTIMTFLTVWAWIPIAWDINSKIKSYGKKHGHPSLYTKKV